MIHYTKSPKYIKGFFILCSEYPSEKRTAKIKPNRTISYNKIRMNCLIALSLVLEVHQAGNLQEGSSAQKLNQLNSYTISKTNKLLHFLQYQPQSIVSLATHQDFHFGREKKIRLSYLFLHFLMYLSIHHILYACQSSSSTCNSI